MAYYRSANCEEYRQLLDHERTPNNFWRVANANFIDTCVLEWCKLFAESTGKHSWKKVVTDPASFKTGLLRHLGLDEEEFEKTIESMKVYRDKFLAHLDDENTMHIPVLDIARNAVWFYHTHIVTHEAESGDLAGLPKNLAAGYEDTEDEAKAIYMKHTS